MKMLALATAMLGAAVLSAPAAAADFTYTGPATIPDRGAATPFPITFNVTGLGTITDVNLTVSGLTHTFAADLLFVLRAPNGTAAYLLAEAGSGADFENATLTFDQQASGFLSEPLMSGTYLPTVASGAAPQDVFGFPVDFSTNLDSFNGLAANGIWEFYVFDDATRDQGSIAGVTLSVNGVAAPVPEPATWAMMMLGIGVVGGALRRSRRVAVSYA